MSQTSIHSSSGSVSIRSIPLNLFLTFTVLINNNIYTIIVFRLDKNPNLFPTV